MQAGAARVAGVRGGEHARVSGAVHEGEDGVAAYGQAALEAGLAGQAVLLHLEKDGADTESAVPAEAHQHVVAFGLEDAVAVEREGGRVEVR